MLAFSMIKNGLMIWQGSRMLAMLHCRELIWGKYAISWMIRVSRICMSLRIFVIRYLFGWFFNVEWLYLFFCLTKNDYTFCIAILFLKNVTYNKKNPIQLFLKHLIKSSMSRSSAWHLVRPTFLKISKRGSLQYLICVYLSLINSSFIFEKWRGS